MLQPQNAFLGLVMAPGICLETEHYLWMDNFAVVYQIDNCHLLFEHIGLNIFFFIIVK